MNAKPYKLILWIACIGALAAMPATAQVQPLDYKPDSGPGAAAPAAQPVWKIYPAAEPDPALKYRFWPDRFEMVAGNTFVPFQRAMILMLEKNRGHGAEDAFVTNYEQWMEGPLDELPKQEVSQYLDSHRQVMTELHRALQMRDSQYELGIDNLRGVEAVQLLLPEFQNMRQLARLLALETRLALAEGRIDDAIRSIRVGFRMGEATGNAADLLISRLVGVAISSMMLNQVELLMQMQDGPNAYWALATLPDSITDMDDALRFEASIVSRVFPELSSLPTENVEPEAWRGRLVRAVTDLQSLGGSPPFGQGDPAARLIAGTLMVALSEPSRVDLMASGMDEAEVRAMSPSEAVVRATAQQVNQIQDDFVKWLLLPESMRLNYIERAEAAVQGNATPNGRVINLAASIAGTLLPAINATNSAGLRTRQTIARLATVEAIRDYAATHRDLPESLDQLTNLPAWPDPFTQQSFGYERESATRAKLHSRPGYPRDPNATIVLELVSP